MRLNPILTSYSLGHSNRLVPVNFKNFQFVNTGLRSNNVTTIGGATRDSFYTSTESTILYENGKPYIAYPLGAKLEAKSQTATGGGAVNTAINFANLGFETSILTKTGDDPKGCEIERILREDYGINTSYMIMEKNGKTASSGILKHEYLPNDKSENKLDDRTVLADRGVGSTMQASEINQNAIKNADWIMLAPLNGESAKILDSIALYAEYNNVNMAMIVGKSSIAKGFETMKPTLATAEIVIMNKEEASDLTGIEIIYDAENEDPSNKTIHPDLKKIFQKIKSTNAKAIVITDGANGSYAYDGEKYYVCPAFPAKVVNTLGAGDIFASTFVASIIKTNGDIEQSLKYASVNSSAVVEQFGAHDGILKFEEMDKKLSDNDSFKITTIPG